MSVQTTFQVRCISKHDPRGFVFVLPNTRASEGKTGSLVNVFPYKSVILCHTVVDSLTACAWKQRSHSTLLKTAFFVVCCSCACLCLEVGKCWLSYHFLAKSKRWPLSWGDFFTDSECRIFFIELSLVHCLRRMRRKCLSFGPFCLLSSFLLRLVRVSQFGLRRLHKYQTRPEFSSSD